MTRSYLQLISERSQELLHAGHRGPSADQNDPTPPACILTIPVIEPVQSVFRNIFTRRKLKGEPFQVMDPVTDQDIDLIKRHL